MPSEFPADGRTVKVIGTGFDPLTVYSVIIDNQYMTNIKANGEGFLYVELVAAGFTPGNHSAALYPYDPLSLEDSSPPSERVPDFIFVFRVIGTTADDVLVKLHEIQTRLDELETLIVLVQGDIAVIKTDVSEVKVSLDDLKVLITQLGDRIELKLGEVNESLATLVVSKGDEVVATIQASLEDLNAVITSVDNGVATLQTALGEVTAKLDDLLGGQAEIKDLVTTESGDVAAVVETARGDILAELGTLEDLVRNGVKADTENILSKLDTVLSDLADVKSATADVKTATTGLEGKISSAASDVKSHVDTAVDDLKSALDGVGGSVTTFGAVNIVLLIIALILLGYGVFRKKP